MKKVIRNTVLIFIILLISNLNVKAYEYDYEITKYDIEMIVSEDNTFKIKETIGVYFNEPKHGIYRKIPLNNTIIRTDGSTSSNEAVIKDVNVNNNYIVNREYGNYVIKIGSANETLIGSQEYIINYTYSIGNDKEKKFDELYYNLIGTGWDTTIKNVTFKITMPKSFDQSKLGFSRGKYGSTISDGITYQVNDNIITGSYNDTLNPSYALTVRLELPEGYFKENTDYATDLANNYDYVIKNYDVEMKVNLDNSFDIKENINANFNVPKSGISKTLPIKEEFTRIDGTKSRNRVKITDIKINQEYTISKDNNELTLKVEDPSNFVIGPKQYIINYKYNLGKDRIKKYDELYYDLIETDWDTIINNITFKIIMPKEFDKSKIVFSHGKYGSIIKEGLTYQVNDNTITGTYDNILDSYEGLTIRIELPDGYYTDAKYMIDLDIDILLMFIIPILSLVISIFLWFKFGIDDRVIETVEFYPPNGLNSLEIGYLYKGEANNKDVTSLLIYLANKGYLKITETESLSLFTTTKNFKITKLKEYDGNNINEQLFFKGLFQKSNEVTKEDLYDNFYVTMNEILRNVNTKENKNKIFDKKSSKLSIVIIILLCISFLTTFSVPTIKYGPEFSFIMVFFICLFYIVFIGFCLSEEIPLIARIVMLVPTIASFTIVLKFIPIVEAIKDDNIYLFGMIVGILCLVGMLIAFKLIIKRTKYGVEILGRIKGFKNFLETAEKEKLEALVFDNPTYFYDILPYTYVLGISNLWIEKFESISLQAPDWYNDSDNFDMEILSTFISTTMASVTTSMSSSHSSDSGDFGSSSDSSGSGGGSSGGGSGGGGGGSW